MTKSQLLEIAISNSLFPQTSLFDAFQRLKFVQADPIRSPARAQDLILRHRVDSYKNGDLDKKYEELGIEEDFLYAYGFMATDLWRLFHPRTKIELTEYDRQVLDITKDFAEINSKDLIKKLGSKQEVNGWGGKSQAIRNSLERLHYYGLVKVARREKGQRVYKQLSPVIGNLSVQQRLEQSILAVVEILAPVTSTTLNMALSRIRRQFGPTKTVIAKLVKDGLLSSARVDGIEYFWPAGINVNNELVETVKFLAPFDPVVWDRQRFEHLWGWQYRFEAYVPKAKRVRGYYAMPMLWRDKVVGWANVDKNGEVQLGFVDGKPKDKRYNAALDLEIANIREFLNL